MTLKEKLDNFGGVSIDYIASAGNNCLKITYVPAEQACWVEDNFEPSIKTFKDMVTLEELKELADDIYKFINLINIELK